MISSKPSLTDYLLRLEWLMVLILAPLAMFPAPNRVWPLLLIPVFWLLRRWHHSRCFPLTPLNLPIWGLCLMGLIGFLISDDRSQSWPKLIGLLYGASLFFAVAQPSRALAKRLAALLACGTAVALVGLVGIQWTDKFAWLARIMSRLPQRLLALPGAENGISPNEVAGVLLWVLPIGLVLCWLCLRHGRSLWPQQRWLALAAALFVYGSSGIMTAVLLLSQSRAGFLGLLAGLTTLFLLGLARIRWWLAAILIGLGLLAATAVWQQQPDLFLSQLEAQSGSRSLENLASRSEIWQRAIYAIQDFPLTGMGLNRFRELVFSYYPTFFLRQDQDFAHAHNHLLQTAVDLGLPGLICYLAIWLLTAVMLWQLWRHSPTPWGRGLALGLIAALAAYFVYGLVDTVALGAKPGFIFWFVLAITAVLHGQLAGATPADNGSSTDPH